jgi:hypothetical protein
MPIAFNEGLIYLIPKGEEPLDEIQKWMPIIILNTVYTILAKVVSLKLQYFLTSLIVHDSQISFIKE